ncbi:hypothetical protein GCM10007866_09890 [Gluconobacter albidus]|uniref:Uncharacterized protein n=1 Tax=Gluconobacter albidus TaxID=318683 RepID=A0ABQ5X0W1_9PROT|nr:hypothetical protein GCM10007866_09890 [Gluconobacter albidus]
MANAMTKPDRSPSMVPITVASVPVVVEDDPNTGKTDLIMVAAQSSPGSSMFHVTP